MTTTMSRERLFASCMNSIETEDSRRELREILDELYRHDLRYLVDIEDETHRSPLFHAIETGKSLDFIRILLNFPVRLTGRILLAAIRYGQIDLLQLLHQNGGNFQQTSHGLSLLHECILLHKNHFIRFLIDEANIDPNIVDADNQTPLFYAISRTNIEAIRTFLSYSTVDPCQIFTKKQSSTAFHLACELGIDEVLPLMLKSSSSTHLNRLSRHDQTPFDLFLSCYFFTKNNLFMNDVALEKFSFLFDLFISFGAKLHHLTKAYRRTRAPFVTKILNILWRKSIPFDDIILNTGRSTIFKDLQSLVCEALCDWPYLVESNETILWKQQQMILRELYDLFLLAYFKSVNQQPIDQKFLIRHCKANEKSSKIRQILWSFLRSYIENDKQPRLLKSICRKQILCTLKSVDKHCTTTSLEISQRLASYLLFFVME